MGLFSGRIGLPVRSAGTEVARVEPPASAQVVAAAGAAVVSAVKVGRLLTRTGWGLARRLPGGEQVQREVQKLQDAAINEVRRVLDVPTGHSASPEEERAVLLIKNADPDGEPLRAAMSELLDRSVEDSRISNREYLYGNIISQLVPDEARILAALSDGTKFAVVDVVAKPGIGRNNARTVLANASSVGRLAGVTSLDNVSTYITRLNSFGLVHLLPEDPALITQYEILATEADVQAAEASIEAGRAGSPKLVRKTLVLSQFGRQFWQASAPTTADPRPALPAPSPNGTDPGHRAH